jgi:hypothetical protein
MHYLVRFIGACFITVAKPASHFLYLVFHYLYYLKLPKYNVEELEALKWESNFFHCKFYLSNAFPHTIYRTFWDYVKGNEIWVGSGLRRRPSVEDYQKLP